MNTLRVLFSINRRSQLLCFLLCFVGPLLASASPKESLIMCKLKGLVRTLRVEKLEDKTCRAVYTKMGVDEIIGSGQYESSCLEHAAKVRKTLEDASWICRDVKESQSTNTQVDAR